MRGAPQRGLARDMVRTSSASSDPMRGRPRSRAPGLPGPERTEALSMPANHSFGANDVERLAPPCPTPRKPDPEGAIQRSEPWSCRPAAEQGELLSERQVLKRQIPVGPDCGAESAQ